MTTYSQPDKFSHGDFPTKNTAGRSLDSLIDAMNAIGELLTDSTTPVAAEVLPQFNFAVMQNYEQQDPVNYEDSNYWIMHRQRYLHYKSSGAVEDSAGLETEVALPNDDTYNVYDLDTVSWLNYGMMYKVTGVDFCCEDVDP